MNEIDTGLEGVVIGATEISHVGGEAGRLSYRGHDIATLCQRPFPQVIWLLLFGELPGAQQEQQLAHFLLAHAPLAESDRKLLAAVPEGTHPMLMLQSLVPLLSLQQREDLEIPNRSEDAVHGLIIAARLPALAPSPRSSSRTRRSSLLS